MGGRGNGVGGVAWGGMGGPTAAMAATKTYRDIEADMENVLDTLAGTGALVHRSGGGNMEGAAAAGDDGTCWTACTSKERTAERRQSVRNIATAQIEVLEEGTDRVMDELNLREALFAVHPGAVYIHQGKEYVVSTLDIDRGEARVCPCRAPVPYYTTTRDHVDVNIVSRRYINLRQGVEGAEGTEGVEGAGGGMLQGVLTEVSSSCWIYGPGGLRVWHRPGHIHRPLQSACDKGGDPQQEQQKLEEPQLHRAMSGWVSEPVIDYDVETYPLGVVGGLGAIAGIAQRSCRNHGDPLPR